MNEQLDPQIVNLAKAIRQTESSGDFNAKGASGEWGGYQYTKDTWDEDNKTFGTNYEYGKATPQQQNELAYKKLKSLKEKGYNVGQVASIWNSGQPEWEGKKGTNKHGVKYDVPKYVDSVSKTYQSFKSGGNTVIPNPSTVTPQDPGQRIVEQSQQRIKDLTPPPAPATQEPEVKDSFGKGLLKSILGAPLTMAARPLQLAASLGGVPTEKIDEVSSRLSGGLVAPTPKGVGDVGKDVLRGVETALPGILKYGAGKLAKGFLGTPQFKNALESSVELGRGSKGGYKVADFVKRSAAEQYNILSEALATTKTPIDKIILENALKEILPKALKEAGIKVAKSPTVKKGLLEKAGEFGGLLNLGGMASPIFGGVKDAMFGEGKM